MNRILFSSEKTDWETPQYLFDFLNKIFNFDLDVCASNHNSKCTYYLDKETNALIRSWKLFGEEINTICWMNPPYGKKESLLWVKKAHEEAQDGRIIVGLLPARTDTQFFHDYILKYNYDYVFIKGRLNFSNSKNGATYPSMIVLFQKKKIFKLTKDFKNKLRLIKYHKGED